jgi:hypothetical protein
MKPPLLWSNFTSKVASLFAASRPPATPKKETDYNYIARTGGNRHFTGKAI